MIYFTADEHYFHKNIIKYCPRPFGSVDEMDKQLIKNHNSFVNEDDIVYHLGDFAFVQNSNAQKIEPILDKLNGRHHLILGNHDQLRPFTYVNLGFISVHTALQVEEFVLIHDPALAVAVSRAQKVLCGHIHDLTKFVSDNILNVGVDATGYDPISIEQVRAEFEKCT